MDWIKWLVPLIILAGYILSHLAKNREEPRRSQRPPLPPPLPPRDSGERPAARRSPSEVDRFLEEVRRRRETGEKPTVPAAREPSSRGERERPRPASKITAAEPVLRPQRTGREEPPKPRPARRPSGAQEAAPFAKLVPAPAPAPPSLAETAAAQAVMHFPSPAAKPVSPAAQQLLELLKTPQSLQTAILLREVLDRPRCRRPRR